MATACGKSEKAADRKTAPPKGASQESQAATGDQPKASGSATQKSAAKGGLEIRAKAVGTQITRSPNQLVSDQKEEDFVIVEYEMQSRSDVKLKEWGCFFKNWTTDHEAVRIRKHICNVDKLEDFPVRKGRIYKNSVKVWLLDTWNDKTVEFRICYTPVDADKVGPHDFPLLGEFCSNPIKLEVAQ